MDLRRGFLLGATAAAVVVVIAAAADGAVVSFSGLRRLD